MSEATQYLDTPRVITDSQGNKVWEWQNSDPFGNNVPDENPSGLGQFKFDLKFPGQVADKETNTFYNTYRDAYDPALDRYTQFDPIGLREGINGFAYVGGNSLSFTDPYGLVRWGDVANSTLGLLGAGMGTVLGGALVAAPTGVSQVVGAAVLAKSLYSMGTSSYNLTRAFSDKKLTSV